MKLDALPGSQPKCVVGILGSQIIIHSILIRRENTAGDAPSDHEHELFPCLSQIPVVLLVDAVEFEKLPVVVGKAVGFRIEQRRSQFSR